MGNSSMEATRISFRGLGESLATQHVWQFEKAARPIWHFRTRKIAVRDFGARNCHKRLLERERRGRNTFHLLAPSGNFGFQIGKKNGDGISKLLSDTPDSPPRLLYSKLRNRENGLVAIFRVDRGRPALKCLWNWIDPQATTERDLPIPERRKTRT